MDDIDAEGIERLRQLDEQVKPGGVTYIRQTDADKAADLRAKLRPILEQACEIIAAARRDGLIITFNLSPDQYGVTRVMALDVVKPL